MAIVILFALISLMFHVKNKTRNSISFLWYIIYMQICLSVLLCISLLSLLFEFWNFYFSLIFPFRFRFHICHASISLTHSKAHKHTHTRRANDLSSFSLHHFTPITRDEHKKLSVNWLIVGCNYEVPQLIYIYTPMFSCCSLSDSVFFSFVAPRTKKSIFTLFDVRRNYVKVNESSIRFIVHSFWNLKKRNKFVCVIITV